MASKTFSIRLTNAEVELLQLFQDPHGETLNQTVARLVRETIGATSTKAVNNTANTVNIKELIAEKIEQAQSLRAIDCELIRDEIDNRTEYLATAMNEVKSQLENEIESLKNELKQLKEEMRSHLPVMTEVTTQDVVSSLLQEELENAIAPEPTQENVVSAPAVKKLSPAKLKSIATSIQNTFRDRKIEVSQTHIKSKILEMYPNPDDWTPRSDARRDVIRALEKQHK